MVCFADYDSESHVKNVERLCEWLTINGARVSLERLTPRGYKDIREWRAADIGGGYPSDVYEYLVFVGSKNYRLAESMWAPIRSALHSIALSSILLRGGNGRYYTRLRPVVLKVAFDEEVVTSWFPRFVASEKLFILPTDDAEFLMHVGLSHATEVPNLESFVRREGVFICYRRDDEPGFSGRIYDRLSSKFGVRNVFIDVSSVELGVDFVNVLEATISTCVVMIVIIGQSFVDARDVGGRRRIDDPADYVRLEIETALDQEIRIIPVIVNGAPIPKASDLPSSLVQLTRRNACEITHERFNSDIMDLISTIEKNVARV